MNTLTQVRIIWKREEVLQVMNEIEDLMTERCQNLIMITIEAVSWESCGRCGHVCRCVNDSARKLLSDTITQYSGRTGAPTPLHMK